MNPKTTYYYPKMFVVKIFALGLAVGIILTVTLAVTHRSTASADVAVLQEQVNNLTAVNEQQREFLQQYEQAAVVATKHLDDYANLLRQEKTALLKKNAEPEKAIAENKSIVEGKKKKLAQSLLSDRVVSEGAPEE